MRFDRDIYFANVRDNLFEGAMEQIHVDGQSVIFAVWEYQGGGTPMDDARWLAYMLATVYHETAARMWPITEYGSESYLQGKEYWPYIGRGFVQLTWETTMKKPVKFSPFMTTVTLSPTRNWPSILSLPPAFCFGAWQKAGSLDVSSASISTTLKTTRSTHGRSSTATTTMS